jgi:hypothetical protein
MLPSANRFRADLKSSSDLQIPYGDASNVGFTIAAGCCLVLAFICSLVLFSKTIADSLLFISVVLFLYSCGCLRPVASIHLFSNVSVDAISVVSISGSADVAAVRSFFV